MDLLRFLQVRFVGNVAVGSEDLRASELRKCYNAVVLAYGAAKDRQLDIPGESLANVLPARTFVGLYNGWLTLIIREAISIHRDWSLEDASCKYILLQPSRDPKSADFSSFYFEL